MKQGLRHRQQGATLVEILVASLVGVFLLYGALSVLLGSRLSHQFLSATSEVERRGRLALELLAEDIRAAAYSGCGATDTEIIVAVPGLPQEAWSQQVLAGVDGGGSTPGDVLAVHDLRNLSNSLLGVPVLAGSDMILLGRALPHVMDVDSVTLAPPVLRLQANPATLTGFPDRTTRDQDRVLMVSDCVYNMAVTAVSFAADGTVDLDAGSDLDTLAVLTSMEAPQAVMIQSMVYYLTIADGRERPSLYRRDIRADGTPEPGVEILPGVINLQFLYGENIDSRPSADRYVSADRVESWENVVSVRIYMLVESEQEASGGQGEGFTYFGSTYAPADANDRRIRRAFSTTVTLRNRMSGLPPAAGD